MRGKLLLLGDHAVVYGRPCLVAAINRYVTVELIKKIGRESEFVATARKLFEQRHGLIDQGLKIKGFSRRYGLGSSAAVTAAVAKALFSIKKIKISQQQLFDFCYQVVRKVQGVASGFDLAAAIYGGVVYFVTAGKIIEKLAVKELPLVVGYSGVKADTAQMIKQAKKNINEVFLGQSTRIVEQARAALVQKNWVQLGQLMNQNQALLSRLGVSTPKLDAMVKAANQTGAYGAKLSGAGGGDCMIALVEEPKKTAVEKAIELVGGKVLKVRLAL